MRRLLHVTTTDISLELLLGPQLRAFQDAGFEVHTASAPGPFVPALEADGIVHHPLRHATRSTAFGEDLLALVELYRLFRELRPDIVHTHNPKPGVYGRIAARLARVPRVVNTQHGLYAQPTDRWARKLPVYALERMAAAFSHTELVQNEEDVATLRQLRVPAGKLNVLGNGIDLERFRPRPEVRREVRAEFGVTDDTIVVGAVGRLVWEKGYAELFEAAKAIIADRTKAGRNDVVFVVAGPDDTDKGDPLTPADVASAEAAGVRMLGHRDDPERLYQAFDIYVLASHREGFPRSAMEAAATGLPIVACDIRGCRQVVDHGTSGLLAEVRNPRALQAAIETLLDDADLRNEMSRAARDKAARDFDQDSVIERTLAAYGGVEPEEGCPESIVHVLPSDLRRGAQTYAQALLPELEAERANGMRNTAVTLFASDAVRLAASSLEVPDGWPRRAGFDPRVLLRLRRHLRHENAALVVAHGGESLKYVAMVARGRPLVYLKIGQATDAAHGRVRGAWHRWLIGRADGVVGVSTAVADEAQHAFGASPDRVRVIPNGRDPERYPPTDRAGRTGVPRLLFVGHLTETKRPGLFISIVRELRRRGAPLTAAIVGGGPQLAELEGPAAAAGVELLGSRDDVPAQLAEADGFVFTSVAEGEGMPGVLIEAALSGLPIVTTRVPGADDVVVDGTTGYVREVDDFDGLVTACESLLVDDEARSRLGAAGRRRAFENFTLAAGTRQWEELFSDLL